MRTWKTKIKDKMISCAVSFDCDNGKRAYVECVMSLDVFCAQGGTIAVKEEVNELIKRFCENNNTKEV